MKQFKSAVALAAVSAALLQGCGKKMTAQEYMQSAVSFYEQQDYGRARVQFRNALREDSAIAEAYYYLSLISEAKGDTYVAYADIQRALELAPDNEKIRLKVAEYYVLTGQFAKAIDHVQSVFDNNPAQVEACKVMAASLIGQQLYQRAIQVSERCQSSDDELQALRIIALKFDGQLEVASVEVAELIARAPEIQSYRLMALELAQLRGDYDSSVAVLEELMALVPADERPVLTLASVLSKAGKEQRAFEVLTEFNRQNPKNKPVKRVLLEVAEQKGLANLGELLDQFLVQLPNDAGLQLLQVSHLLKGGQADEAKALLTRIIEAEPDDNEAYLNAQLLLARLYILENNWSAAREHLTALLSKSPYHMDALLLAGTAALSLRDGPAAMDYAEKFLAREPEHIGAMNIKASALGLLGDSEQQKLWYEKILAKDANALAARDFLVGDSIQRQRLNDAKRWLKSWPQVQRGGSEYAMRTLQLAMAEKRWPAAREALKKLASLVSLGWRESLFEAQILAGEGRRAEAVDAYQQVIGVQPSYVAAYDELSQLIAPSDHSAIGQWLETLIEKDSKNIPAVILLAHMLERAGNSASAAQTFEQALAANPEWLQGYKLLAQVHQRQGDASAALAIYEKGLQAVPEDAFLLAGKAALLEAIEEYDRAAQLYELLLKKQPNSRAIRNNYALLLVSHEAFRSPARIKKAQALVTEFAAINSPALQDTYGWVLYHAGDFRSAENVLRLVNENMPSNPEVLFHLASALAAQNEPHKNKVAKKYIVQALSLKVEDSLRGKLMSLDKSLDLE